jgi:hypothetical protein
MKNIFKFMGVALLACSMIMVSCKKDDENSNESKLTVNHGTTAFDAASVQAVDYTANGYITLYGFKSASAGQNDIFVQGYLESSVVSGATYESTDGDIMNYRDPSIIFTDTEGILNPETPGGDYWGIYTLPSTFVENITAVDLNALTMSGNWSAKTVLLEDYADAGTFEGLTQTDFTGEMVNMTWTWASK